MRHRRISARQVRQRLKAMARTDAPAFLPPEEDRAAYQTTAVQPAENRNRRPRRIAAMAAACALLLTGHGDASSSPSPSARPGGLLRGQRQQRRFFLCASRF